jgi:hypothetical protein
LRDQFYALSVSQLQRDLGDSWIAKEAGYFAAEGLDIELVRVGGSTRIVEALLSLPPILNAWNVWNDLNR